MDDHSQLETRLQRLEDIEEIKQLKHRYLRCLDTKQWDGLAETLCEDATTSYADGEYSFEGREKIVGFLKATPLADKDGLIGVHHCQQPEIELTGPASARGTWALYNYLLHKKEGMGLRLCAFYHDEYEKVEGQWKIKSTGYERVFEETWKRSDIPSLTLLKG